MALLAVNIKLDWETSCFFADVLSRVVTYFRDKTSLDGEGVTFCHISEEEMLQHLDRSLPSLSSSCRSASCMHGKDQGPPLKSKDFKKLSHVPRSSQPFRFIALGYRIQGNIRGRGTAQPRRPARLMRNEVMKYIPQSDNLNVMSCVWCELDQSSYRVVRARKRGTYSVLV